MARKPFLRQTKVFLIISIVVVAAEITGIIWLLRTSKPVTPHRYSTSEVQAGINAVNKEQPASSLSSYEQAFVAGNVYTADGNLSKAYAAYQRAESLAGVAGAKLYVDLAETAVGLQKNSDAQKYWQDAYHASDFKTLPAATQKQVQQGMSG